MDGCVKQPLPPAFRGLPVARVFVDVWDEPRVEDSFAVMPGIKPAIEIEIRAVDFQIRQSGHALEGVQSLWQEYGIRLIRRRHGKRSQHVAVVVHDRDDLLTRLMFVRVALDWCALLLALYLLSNSDVQAVMNVNARSLAMVTLLALGTFVVGVQARVWRICAVGC